MPSLGMPFLQLRASIYVKLLFCIIILPCLFCNCNPLYAKIPFYFLLNNLTLKFLYFIIKVLASKAPNFVCCVLVYHNNKIAFPLISLFVPCKYELKFRSTMSQQYVNISTFLLFLMTSHLRPPETFTSCLKYDLRNVYSS